MSTPPLNLLVAEHWWNPLVYVPASHHGYLVQPGTTLRPVKLVTGWHWHWPILTTIKLIATAPLPYPIGQYRPTTTQLADEPVIAVSKDLALVSIEGQLTLQLDMTAASDIIAKLAPHSINRRIRPAIRHALRQIVAEYRVASLQPSPDIDQGVRQHAASSLKDCGIIVTSCAITSIKPFNPLNPPTATAMPLSG